MTINEMTYRQGQALASFLAELRGDWDRPGIEYALGKARGIAPAADLAVAAIKAAALGSNRTPSIIAMEGPHWRGSESKPRYEQPEKSQTCSTCYQRRDVCRSRWAGDHDFEPLSQVRRAHETALDQARAELAAAKAGLCACGVVPGRCADHDPRRAKPGPDHPDEADRD
jgi:hypothetical protein